VVTYKPSHLGGLCEQRDHSQLTGHQNQPDPTPTPCSPTASCASLAKAGWTRRRGLRRTPSRIRFAKPSGTSRLFSKPQDPAWSRWSRSRLPDRPHPPRAVQRGVRGVHSCRTSGPNHGRCRATGHPGGGRVPRRGAVTLIVTTLTRGPRWNCQGGTYRDRGLSVGQSGFWCTRRYQALAELRARGDRGNLREGQRG
jgi:hypothetical protein